MRLVPPTADPEWWVGGAEPPGELGRAHTLTINPFVYYFLLLPRFVCEYKLEILKSRKNHWTFS